jgi:DMSO/TMAO reductase YedYZ molybdopterin-dependent catalytic subunit
VLPEGLDANVVSGGVDLGKVRRPLPMEKALNDVLLAYEMNGAQLPPDHGFPVRLVVPGWVGIASIKWLGRIEVSTQPLFSPWNTTSYRMFGPDYPVDSPPLTSQPVKSALELARGAVLPAGRGTTVTGRAWSGTAAIRRVEISADRGATWADAELHGPNRPGAWVRWRFELEPSSPGPCELWTRATDDDGRVQPSSVPFNTFGYLYSAVVRHPVVVA